MQAQSLPFTKLHAESTGVICTFRVALDVWTQKIPFDFRGLEFTSGASVELDSAFPFMVSHRQGPGQSLELILFYALGAQIHP